MPQRCSVHRGALGGIHVPTARWTGGPPSTCVLSSNAADRSYQQNGHVRVLVTPTALRQTRGGSRCLGSVLTFVDTWVIVDTGSTDGTQSIIRELATAKPGELHERPWVSFGHNRNEALELARGKADYLFFIDADETLRLPRSFEFPALDGDGYYISCEYAGTRYGRWALVSGALPWRWEGIVHEYLTCDRPFTLGTLVGPAIVVAHDGARSRNPLTYLKDAALLEDALRHDPEHARNVFYLAQSYRDAGELERSRELYRRRAEMGGWEEEVWFSLYQAAILDERLGAEARWCQLPTCARSRTGRRAPNRWSRWQ